MELYEWGRTKQVSNTSESLWYKMCPPFNYVSLKKVAILLPAFDIFFPSWIGLMSRIFISRLVTGVLGVAVDLANVNKCFLAGDKKTKALIILFPKWTVYFLICGSISYLLRKLLLVKNFWIVWIKVYTISFMSSTARAILDFLSGFMWVICLKLGTFCKNLSVQNMDPHMAATVEWTELYR